ncbi:helix-turn-helix transcriptional regulator [Nocardiopsis ansamitocini]|uniref:AraC family transcriptional regulator n=1 Tax=Nocardiopsis ansamitocini TaxID=1670832 RepID=A0A9W6P392_9ACTN|nr:helix-turn-helix transcriptional regulator [Nocardiopsis ansamitocini]GLU46281.1 AraC family transcriptional regulator [Nocardiopsis ansamitocini]
MSAEKSTLSEPPLLTNYHRASSTRIEDLHAAVEPLAVGHDLRALSPGHPLDGVVNGAQLGLLSLVWVRYGGSGVVVETPPTEGHFAMCAPQAPMGVRYQRAGSAGSTAGSLVLSQDEKMWMSPDPVAGCMVLASSMGTLEDHLELMTGEPSSTSLRFLGAGNPTVHGAEVIDQTWRYVVRMLDEVSTGAMHPMAVRALEQSLLTTVLLGLPHTSTDVLLAGRGESRGRADGMAGLLDWLEANHRRPIGVADLARAMGMSIRGLQGACRRTYGTTPMALLRQVRLDHARRALRHAEPTHASVAAIAHQAGFTHLGRFAALYRRRFGEMPSQTMEATPIAS